MRYKPVLSMVVFFLSTCLATAQNFEFYPGASYDQEVPTLNQVVGHTNGERVTSHAETEKYIKALADASSRIELVEYAKSWEGRTLYYLIVASDENMSRLDDIKTGIQKLADPRKTNSAEAEHLIKTLPSICWLEYGVHGNEISSTDAGVLAAYHLVASQNDDVAAGILKNTVVIIDPMQNPDGRDRFINYFRQTRGRWPDEDPQAAEHNEVWPGGRTNHYLFDMNRDWFALTQPETRGRVEAFLQWYPQVFVDLHEMGSNSTYYFAPPADPLNPEMPRSQLHWLQTVGKNNAQWFDKMQFDYFTREVFDSFYPGYGEGWPMFQGAIGMTYEQASVRGLVVKRSDETAMHYRNSVQHHFIASISTAQTAAENREAILRYFYDYRRSAMQEGARDVVKEYIFPPGKDPLRVQKLISNLLQQGIEVQRADAAFSNSKVKDYYGGKIQSKNFPPGTFIISSAQPAKRLVKTLLAKQVSMDANFLQEQQRRYKKRLRDEIYDITGWSLPLLYDVEAYMAEAASGGPFTVLKEAGETKLTNGEATVAEAQLAYLIPWGSQAAAKALAHIFRKNIRVFSADKSFTQNGRTFPNGSLIIKVKDNPKDVQQKLEDIAVATGAEIVPTNSSWVDKGVNFGSGNVRFLKKPKVALAYQRPTHPYSVGWTRYILEQAYGYPVTIINTRQLGRLDLSKYNVLILPNSSSFSGSYRQIVGDAGAKRIKTWVQNGGTLITFAEATRWLTGEKVGLLSTTREFRGGKPEKKKEQKKPEAGKAKPKPDAKKPEEPFDLEKALEPEEELPQSIPGAIMRVTLDTEFWPAFGYDGDANVLVTGRNIYTPLKLDKGRNIGLYMPEDKVMLSGFNWADAQKQIANKAYLMYQRHGRGHVVAFAEDPNIRAFTDGLNVLFLNAVFFGPGH
ncbi:MAG: M14 family metallopeptidase [bacterium]